MALVNNLASMCHLENANNILRGLSNFDLVLFALIMKHNQELVKVATDLTIVNVCCYFKPELIACPRLH